MPIHASGRRVSTVLPLPQQSSNQLKDFGDAADTPQASAGRHPLRVLQQALSAPHRRRRDKKTVVRGYVASALHFLRAGSIAHSHAQWKEFTAHCDKYQLDAEHELARAMPHDDHPLTQMLQHEDYQGIAILMPLLDTAIYDSTFVKRTEQGIYVGQRSGSTALPKLMVAEGRGICCESDGSRKQGVWHDHQPVLVSDFPSSGVVEEYCGQMFNHQYHGHGTLRYKNGDFFTGYWREGRRDGDGTLTKQSGEVLQAHWQDGIMQPGARFETIDGRIYQGNFEVSSGSPRGRVTIMWGCDDKVGACYDGFVERGQPQGIGTYTFGVDERLCGFIYEGPWLNGRKHGCGVLTRQRDGRRSACAYLNDVLQDLPTEGAWVQPETAPLEPAGPAPAVPDKSNKTCLPRATRPCSKSQ